MKNVIFICLLFCISLFSQSVDFMNYTYPYEWLKFSDNNPGFYEFVNGEYSCCRQSQGWLEVTLVKFEKTNYSGNANEYALFFDSYEGYEGTFPIILLVTIKNSKLEFIDSFNAGWSLHSFPIVEFATDRIIVKKGAGSQSGCPSGNCLDEVTTTFMFEHGKFKQVKEEVRQVKEW